MTRVVMIGIDGLDADLLRVYGPSLPHLRRLMLESPFLELKSSFPPESVPAWASIYTGLHPGNHGLLASGNFVQVNTEIDSPRHKIPQGETFWDSASQAGKRVCVINPLLAYPAWPVNGVMLSLPPIGIKGYGPSVLPEEAMPLASFPPLLTSTALPSIHQLKDFCQLLQNKTLQQVECGLELFQREPWDLSYLQLDALDHVQHHLWRYSDPGDPTYPGRNKYSGLILDFYKLFDAIVGRFQECMEQDSTIVVVSGHGHGRRCMQCLNLNEWLRGQQLLTPHARSMRFLDRRYLVERAKHRSMELLTHLQVRNVMPRIAQYFPTNSMYDYTSCLIDQNSTVAQVVELTGTSPFGGIRLNRDCMERNGEDYENVRDSLLQHLAQLRLKGRPAVNWARPREQVYQGKYIECYPDILFELRSEYGVSSDLFVPLITGNLTHQLFSGDHRMQGVLLVGKIAGQVKALEDGEEPVVMDVAPTVLHLLGLESAHCDGRALILPELVKQPI